MLPTTLNVKTNGVANSIKNRNMIILIESANETDSLVTQTFTAKPGIIGYDPRVNNSSVTSD